MTTDPGEELFRRGFAIKKWENRQKDLDRAGLFWYNTKAVSERSFLSLPGFPGCSVSERELHGPFADSIGHVS